MVVVTVEMVCSIEVRLVMGRAGTRSTVALLKAFQSELVVNFAFFLWKMFDINF